MKQNSTTHRNLAAERRETLFFVRAPWRQLCDNVGVQREGRDGEVQKQQRKNKKQAQRRVARWHVVNSTRTSTLRGREQGRGKSKKK